MNQTLRLSPSRIIGTFILCMASFLMMAQTTTWTGAGTAGKWDDPLNWDNGVPDKDKTAEFYFNATINSPAIIDTIDEIHLYNSSQVTIQAGVKLIIKAGSGDGLELDGQSTFINYGEIHIIQNDNDDGIEVDGSDAVFYNFGKITIEGDDIDNGIEIDGVFINKPTGKIYIDFTDDDPDNGKDDGIHLDQDGSVFENYGKILVKNFSGDGIEIDRGGTFYNYATGKIEATTSLDFQDDGEGVEMSDDDALFENYGLIEIDGNEDHAIEVDDDGVFNNYESGRIILRNSDEDGLDVCDSGATFNNYGTLSVFDAKEDGVENSGTINNYETGSIFVNGADQGIYNDGGDNINNYGCITLKNTNSVSINNRGTITNFLCGLIDVDDNAPDLATIVNMGVVKSTAGANVAGVISSTNSLLNCNDLVNVSLPIGCVGILTPQQVLKGSDYICGALKVEIAYPYGYASISEEYGRKDVFNRHMIGGTYTFRVKDVVNQNSCWGQIKVEDKQPPRVDVQNDTVSCAEFAYLKPPHAYDGCSEVDLRETGSEWIPYECGEEFVGIMVRRFIASDAWGNTTEAIDTLWLTPITLQDIVAPRDTVIECCSVPFEYTYEKDGFNVPLPIICNEDGSPTVIVSAPYIVQMGDEDEGDPEEFILPTDDAEEESGREEIIETDELTIPRFSRLYLPLCDELRKEWKCKVEADYKDHIIPTCGWSFKVRREWKIFDWCTGMDTFFVQWIKIVDSLAPVIGETEPAEIKELCDYPDGIYRPISETVKSLCTEEEILTAYDMGEQEIYVKPHECLAHVELTRPPIFKECGLSATIKNGNEEKLQEIYESIKVFYEIKYFDLTHPGKLVAITGEIFYGETAIEYLPAGWYTVIYRVTDECWNEAYACEQVAVYDNTPPTPVCDEITQVTLDPDSCWTRIYAIDLDDGSNDNCKQNLHYAVANMDTLIHWRHHWEERLLECHGEYTYNHHKKYFDHLIDNWLECYVFNDYIDLTECGEEMLVMRVYEADGLPLYDEHTFVGSKHQWFCFNLYDDYACFFKFHYDEFAHYKNPFADLCDYEVFDDNVSIGSYKYLSDPYCSCDGPWPLDPHCGGCEFIGLDDMIVVTIAPDILSPQGKSHQELIAHGPEHNYYCCTYEAYNDPDNTDYEDYMELKSKYPELSKIDCHRYKFQHLYNECMIQVLKDDKEPPVCISPENETYYCDGVPYEWYVEKSYQDGTEIFKLEGQGARFAHDICSISDAVGSTTCFAPQLSVLYIDENGMNKEAIICCIETPWDGGDHGYYGGPQSSGYSYDEELCEENFALLPQGWKPIYCWTWLLLDRYDDPGYGKPNAYAYFGTPTVYDNCWYPAIDSITEGELDECGVGYLTRTWTVTDKCGNTSSCHQTITIKPRSDFEVKFPEDKVVYCDSLDSLAPVEGDPSSYPVITDDDCELIGINYTDQVLDISEDGCYKILRTWKIIDWCVYVPDIHDRYPDVIVNDTCVAGESRPCVIRSLKDDGDGFMTYLQVIKVIDEVAPEVVCNDDYLGCIYDEECDELYVEYELGTATDNCTDELEYRYAINPNGDSPESDWVYGHGNIVQNSLPVGVHTAILYAKDNCGNEGYCMLTIEVKDCKPPTPYCYNGIATVIMPSTGEITVWARDLDAGSFDNCTEDENLRFTFTDTPPEEDSTYVEEDRTSYNTYTCDDLGQVEVQIYVWDETGNVDFCITYLLIQPGSDACISNATTTLMDQKDDMGSKLGVKKSNVGLTINMKSSDGALSSGDQPILNQNRPNPYDQETIISFELPGSMQATIRVLDVTGKEITRIEGQYKAGYHEWKLNRDQIGLQSGILYYQLSTNDFVATKKMVLIE